MKTRRPPFSGPQNSKGFTTLALSLVIVSLGFVLFNSLQDQTLLFAKESVRSRMRLDAEAAIDTFAVELYQAYVLGSEVADSAYGLRYRVTNLVDYKTMKLYVNKDKTQVCYNRGIKYGVIAPICIQMPANLDFSHIGPENEFYFVQTSPEDEPSMPWQEKLVAALKKTSETLLWPQAVAQNDLWDPGMGPIAGLAYPVTRTFPLTFQKRYSNYYCQNPGLDCVKIKFCVRLNNNCKTNEEFVTQAYIFDKLPKHQVRD